MWGTTTKSNIESIPVLQKAVLRKNSDATEFIHGVISAARSSEAWGGGVRGDEGKKEEGSAPVCPSLAFLRPSLPLLPHFGASRCRKETMSPTYYRR